MTEIFVILAIVLVFLAIWSLVARIYHPYRITITFDGGAKVRFNMNEFNYSMGRGGKSFQWACTYPTTKLIHFDANKISAVTSRRRLPLLVIFARDKLVERLKAKKNS